MGKVQGGDGIGHPFRLIDIEAVGFASGNT